MSCIYRCNDTLCCRCAEALLSCWFHRLMEPTRLPTPSSQRTPRHKLCTSQLVQSCVTRA
uniref:Predicted protein n=1 Tax=Hordeum vulgare subsp. vulgare TaxID=112509 RepID=F2CZP4_HORVV|nr:predicted protein [Hordeum vulgare subsp. vulgare]